MEKIKGKIEQHLAKSGGEQDDYQPQSSPHTRANSLDDTNFDCEIISHDDESSKIDYILKMAESLFDQKDPLATSLIHTIH